MYLLLLVFGAALTAAGVVLAATGISVQDRAFDMTAVTPGVVAVVGGLVIFGLGLALRILRRIEQALSVPPMPRAVRPGDVPARLAAPELPPEPTRASLPISAALTSKAAPKVASVLLPVPAAIPVSAGEEQADDLSLPEQPREKAAALTEFDGNRLVAKLDLSPKSLSPAPSARGEEDLGAVSNLRIARRANGTGSSRIMPRFDLGTRPAASAERPKGPLFDSLWPKGSRPLRAAAPAGLTPVAPTTEPGPNDEPVLNLKAPIAPQEAAPVPVSILKSGVVDGMAYTLFSDGSIEAELPQGVLRFGSITELRHHIEQSA